MSLAQFQSIGHELFLRGLIASHSGNMSIRLGERLLITRRGSRLGSLSENDLIETGVSKNDRSTPHASKELAVHRTIYMETPALAVVHAHPPHAIALSLHESEIVPTGVDDFSVVGKVPVIGSPGEVDWATMAEGIAGALKEHQVVMVRGHGSFAIGQLLDEAYSCTTILEESSQIICLSRSLQGVSPTALG